MTCWTFSVTFMSCGLGSTSRRTSPHFLPFVAGVFAPPAALLPALLLALAGVNA